MRLIQSIQYGGGGKNSVEIIRKSCACRDMGVPLNKNLTGLLNACQVCL